VVPTSTGWPRFLHFETVDIEEFVRFRQRRAGHPGELLVHAEVILERDRGERLVLRLDRLVLLRLERLMQAFGVAPARHHAAGELVDDDDLAVAHDIVLVAREQLVSAQRLVDMVHRGYVLDIVERVRFEEVRLLEQALHLLHPGFGEVHGALLLIDIVVGLVEPRDEGVDRVVEVRAVVEWAGNDQRRARLVDQDRVNLIHDRIDVAALDHVLQPVFHVVAQIVEAEFVVGAVGHVAFIGRLALGIVEPMDDDADGEAEELVDLPHPFGIALGEIIVDRDHMDAAAGERIEIDRQRRHERLAFAGLHLGDAALVQHHAADQLHIEMALAERAFAGLAHGRKGRNQEIVEVLAGGEFFAEGFGARAQFFVREPPEFALERVDGIDAGTIGANAPFIGASEEFAGDGAEHAGDPFWSAARVLPRPGRTAVIVPNALTLHGFSGCRNATAHAFSSGPGRSVER
jgi:hypothetical protein